jgi:hypothetical protein
MPSPQFTKPQMDQIARIASRVNRLQDRCDAFFQRREAEQRRKDAKRDAKRAAKDHDDPLSGSSGTTVDWREDNNLEQRPELRTGALSKEQ